MNDACRDVEAGDCAPGPNKRPKHHDTICMDGGTDADVVAETFGADWDENDWRDVRNAAKRLRKAEEKSIKRQQKLAKSLEARHSIDVKQQQSPNTRNPLQRLSPLTCRPASQPLISNHKPTLTAQLDADYARLDGEGDEMIKYNDNTTQLPAGQLVPRADAQFPLAENARTDGLKTIVQSSVVSAKDTIAPFVPRHSSDCNSFEASTSVHGEPTGSEAPLPKPRLPLSRSTGASFALQTVKLSESEIFPEPFRVKYHHVTPSRSMRLEGRPLGTGGVEVESPTQRFYAVRSGHKPDVYRNWSGEGQASDQVRDFPNAVYDLFDEQRDAVWFVYHKSTDCLDKCCKSLQDNKPQISYLINHLTTEVQLCEEQIRLVGLTSRGNNVFFTGSAGTGKSTASNAMFRQLVSTGKRVERLAPTGLTALNIGGKTYFKFLGWTPDSKKRPLHTIENWARKGKRWKRLNEVDVIIIDEISMIEAHQFDRMDAAFRAARQPERCGCTGVYHEESCTVLIEWNESGYGSEDARSRHDPSLPFGGVQVIVTGDFNQLPPVKPFSTCYSCGRETEPRESNIGPWKCEVCPNTSFYLDDRWAFQSSAWKRCNFVNVNLTQIHRQSDPEFVEILETARHSGNLSAGQIAFLLNHPCDTEGTVQLFPKNAQADKCNDENMARIKQKPRFYRCDDNRMDTNNELLSDSNADLLQPPSTIKELKDHRFAERLELKIGMRAMYLVNCPEDPQIVNGSQGEVVGFVPYDPMSLNDHRKANAATSLPVASGEYAGYRNLCVRNWIKQSHTREWPVVRFLNGTKKVIFPVCEVKELGNTQPYVLQSRTQLPLTRAWAITIHKSQGMSLDRVQMNLDESFEPEMTYVAMSRARTMRGLKITSHDGLAVLQSREGSGNVVVREFYEERFGKPKIQSAVLHGKTV